MKHSKVCRDVNHPAIVKALLAEGYSVIDLAAVGKGCPDILVGVFTESGEKFNLLIEIKSSQTAKITTDQVGFRSIWQGQHTIVTSVWQAIEYCKAQLLRSR